MKILIVDDNEDSLLIIKKTLEPEGYAVETVSNGVEALKIVKKFHPDLIISDILMPEMDGFRLCHEIKSDDNFKKILFIFYTATYVDPKDERLAMSLGASKFIIKPVEHQEFLDIVKKVLRECRSGSLSVPENPMEEASDFLGMYNQNLVRKLDKKVLELQHNNNTMAVINSLLTLSQENTHLDEILKNALEHILAIPNLSFESRGCIFIVENDPEILVMKARKGLSEIIQNECGKLPFGKCLCGRAALGSKLEFADTLNSDHEIRHEDMTPHGHYCVPILYGGKTLGVINIYLSEGHCRDGKEEKLLTLIANTLGGIIQRKKTEEEKEKIQNQLLQSQKMETMGILAGGIAHDFNNLLTTIIGNSELSMKITGTEGPLYENLKNIVNAGLRAAGLTRQLLLFFRKQQIEFKPTNLNHTIEELIKMLRRLIGEDIAIKTHLNPGLRDVLADVGSIEQMIMNFTVNASDAMPEGGEITIKTENLSLEDELYRSIAGARPGLFVCLSIKDNGKGMDEKTISQIFEPFFTAKEVGKGTGLGLAIVDSIIKQHKGWINVNSEKGKGSLFQVYLPALQAGEIKQTEDTMNIRGLQGNGERILLVEDDRGVREVAERTLRENGYNVFTATNTKEAVEIFEKENGDFHLVFSDVVLTDKSGVKLLDQLISRKKELRTLLSSGYAGKKSQWETISKRRFPYLQKPYTLAALLRAVKDAIKKER